MSLITCCPACQTMFKVSGEDLRVSDGWVRCGKCDGVFDASLHLQAMPLAPEESSAPADVAIPSFQHPQAGMEVASFPVEQRPSLFRSATPEGFDREPVFIEPELEPEPSLDAPAASKSFEPSPGALRREDRSARPSFSETPVRYSTRATTRSPWRVVFWLFALGVLVVGLLAGARHERQALVQRLPASLPLLDGLCTFSACNVQAPRLLSAIVIEGASMEEVSPSNYKVQLLLKNSGAVDVDLPALNVTLTGLQGDVLATHIASPAQFAPGITRLGRSTPLNVAFTFQAALPSAHAANAVTAVPIEIASAAAAAPAASVEPAAPPVTVSGYRVIAFYP